MAVGTALLLWTVTTSSRADTVAARCDIYPRGSDKASAVLSCTLSQRQGHVSIERADGVRHELTPQGNQAGTYVDQSGKPAYRQSGLGERGLIFRFANESVYVYWDTAGVPGSAAVTGTAASGAANAAATASKARLAAPLDRTLGLNGIRFQVRSPNNSSINMLTIVPSGLEIDNSMIARSIDGVVTGVEVADLNVDGSPEIYVYVASAGSGSYGSLVAFSANRRKSLSQIYLPPLVENKVASKGYMGHDEFAVVENALVQRFPIYRDGDTNAKPTGGMRQLQYKLVQGEAGWILRLDAIVEY
jgi:Periplasmic lysozyme inhibitor of I-type lysozyme